MDILKTLEQLEKEMYDCIIRTQVTESIIEDWIKYLHQIGRELTYTESDWIEYNRSEEDE